MADLSTITLPDSTTYNFKDAAARSDLALKAPLASPALTGVPTAPTAASGTDTTQIATTAFVKTATEGFYQKPSGGIPVTDLVSSVVSADSATSGYLPVADGSGGYSWESITIDVEAITNAEIDALFT